MTRAHKPTVVAGLLAAATTSLVAGTVVVVTHPWGSTAASPTTAVSPVAVLKSETPAPSSPSPSPTPTLAPSTQAPAATSSVAKAPATSPAPATIVYVVRRGDTLSGISLWFHQHGYGAVYDANKGVIGSDPNLIIPGERIVISKGSMTVQLSK